MNEARKNPNAVAKAEGRKTLFSTEINDIAVIVKLAEIGIEGLKFKSGHCADEEESKLVEALLKVGPSVVDKFRATADYLYRKSQAER